MRKISTIAALGVALALLVVNPSPVTLLFSCTALWGLTLPPE